MHSFSALCLPSLQNSFHNYPLVLAFPKVVPKLYLPLSFSSSILYLQAYFRETKCKGLKQFFVNVFPAPLTYVLFLNSIFPRLFRNIALPTNLSQFPLNFSLTAIHHVISCSRFCIFALFATVRLSYSYVSTKSKLVVCLIKY